MIIKAKRKLKAKLMMMMTLYRQTANLLSRKHFSYDLGCIYNIQHAIIEIFFLFDACLNFLDDKIDFYSYANYRVYKINAK